MITKKEIDGEHPASHYLVVEDPEKPSTWHLRVRNVNGELDHRLMGAAWAALHGGYRGNRYEGPKKREALAKLKRLYAREGIDLPSEKAASVKAITDGDEWVLDVRGIPFGSPDDLDSDGQYFSPYTLLHEDKFKSPPVVYYHGYGPDNKPAGKPAYIGKTVGMERRGDGVWFRVVLDKASELAKRVWEAAKQGLARASSGSVSHLVRVGPDGHIIEWPVAELSVFDMADGRQPANRYAVAVPVLKAVYEQAGLAWPDLDSEASERLDAGGPTGQGAAGDTSEVVLIKSKTDGGTTMGDDMITKEDVAQIAASVVTAALEADREAKEAARKAEEERKREIEEAIKAEREKWEQEAAKANRLPFNAENVPYVGKFGELRKYDHLDAGDLACMIQVLEGANRPVSNNAMKALAIKVLEDKGEIGFHAGAALKAQGITDAIKANEVNYSTLTSYGKEWVVTANATQLWESIRRESQVARNLPNIEVPQGASSLKIPLEGTDPVFYKVPEVASDAATGGLSTPSPTVTSSRLGTSNNTLTVAKLGARVRWSGELEEDSIVPWASELRRQLGVAGQEYFEHVIIDGHTATTASTNINDIAGTPAGTEAFLLFNGFRYVALMTSGRNRDGGALGDDDFVATMGLLGTAGEAADPDRCAFIVDLHTHRKMLTAITALKTADVYPGAPTITNGKITQIWGYPVIVTPAMGYVHKYSPHSMTGYEKKFTTTGKINQDTASSNTTGLILLVRWDRWFLGWKRRMTMEVTRHPEWDGSEIVALMRFGLVYRDTTSAAACTYNVTI